MSDFMPVFDNKVAIVTGGTRGIGAAIATALLERGCKVSVSYKTNTRAAQAFQDKMKAAGKVLEKDLLVTQADVSDFDMARKLVEKTMSTFGRVDFLVNNAGIAKDRTAKKMTPQEWNEVIANNLSSIYNCTHNVINHMSDRGSGRVISISSIVALMGNFGQTNYAAAKAGIIGFTKSLALEVASKGITVNAIAPGFTDTDMTRAIPEDIRKAIIEKIPMKRLAQPDEIADLAMYLLSDKASYITGQVISVNGGLYM